MSSLIKLTRTIHFLEQFIMHVCTVYVHKYSVDMYLLCMIKARLGGVLVVYGECFNLG